MLAEDFGGTDLIKMRARVIEELIGAFMGCGLSHGTWISGFTQTLDCGAYICRRGTNTAA
jgi:hypothetical protein